MKKILIIALAILMIIPYLILGFSFFSDINIAQSPQTTIKLQILSITSDEITAKITVDIKNTNPFTITTKNFKVISTTSDGYEISRLLLEDKQINSNDHHVSESISHIKFNKVIPEEITSKISGDITIGTLKKTMHIDINVITEIENIINFNIPSINIDSQFESFENSTISFSSIMSIDNTNSFDVYIDQLSGMIYNDTGCIGSLCIIFNKKIPAQEITEIQNKGSILLTALDSEYVYLYMNGKLRLQIAGAEKSISFNPNIKIKPPNLDKFFSSNPLSITIITDNKLSERKLTSHLSINIFNPTEIHLIAKNVVISTYLIQGDTKTLIKENIIDEPVKMENTTFLENDIEIPFYRPKDRPDTLFVHITADITFEGLNHSFPIELNGYQDLQIFQ